MSTIINIFKALFPSVYNYIVADTINRRDLENFNECLRDRHNAKLLVLSAFVDKPVICITSALENPIIGFAKSVNYIHIDSEPVLIVDDYITGNERWILGKVYEYNHSLLESICKMPKDHLIQLMYDTFSKEYINELQLVEPILSIREINDLLNTNGFFNKFLTYKGII